VRRHHGYIGNVDGIIIVNVRSLYLRIGQRFYAFDMGSCHSDIGDIYFGITVGIACGESFGLVRCGIIIRL
jgi:hypothetical protein